MYVNNLSNTARNYKYIIANRVKNKGTGKYELWFYGAWDDRNRANGIALELKRHGQDAIVLDSENVEGSIYG